MVKTESTSLPNRGNDRTLMQWRLPDRPTAPFCPSEVQGIVTVPPTGSPWRKLLAVVEPGLLVSVGYMDPGNWATDIEGGSKLGHSLLKVIFLSNLMAIERVPRQCF
ncbi:hypothetical protein [Stenomitos frigidus]|uniref:hypothetical protein n=1 Tax=Stenomitos frigidus TaxID=1886765 RepID=UPI0011B21814|nr:hypothetical protein [Stenomitos frigidus]